MKILLVNGPNLNLLGKRNASIYGVKTLDDIVKELTTHLQDKGIMLDSFQSNHEGAIIDKLHAAIGLYDGILINPGAYSHYSYSIRDAIESIGIPTVEVHLSDIHNREPFRAVSVIEPVCIAQVSALGEKSYYVAADILLSKIYDNR